MKRTQPATLVVLVLIGGVAGFLVQLDPRRREPAQAAPRVHPRDHLALHRRARRRPRGAGAAGDARAAVRRHIDPFYATRVVVLAKASSLGGALLTGVAAGFLFELLVRAGSPSTDNFVRALATLAALRRAARRRTHRRAPVHGAARTTTSTATDRRAPDPDDGSVSQRDR